MDLTTVDEWATIVLFAAAVTTGLMAGLYFAFSCAVMPGLGVSSDTTFVEEIQRINQKIINVWFLLVFIGSAILPIVAAILLAIEGDDDALWWSVAAAVLSMAAFVITASRNVPLNNALDAADPIDAIDDPTAVRRAFEEPWVRWNLYRTISCTIALAALAQALRLEG